MVCDVVAGCTSALDVTKVEVVGAADDVKFCAPEEGKEGKTDDDNVVGDDVDDDGDDDDDYDEEGVYDDEQQQQQQQQHCRCCFSCSDFYDYDKKKSSLPSS